LVAGSAGAGQARPGLPADRRSRMDQPDIDARELFDEDYLYFYAEALGDERSDAETELLWRLLELEPGMEVLDLACGHGRIANRLAVRGCRVTGLDATPLFLDRARQDAADRGVEVDYLEGGMRNLPWTGRFDRVVNWFTAFGSSTTPATAGS
jgi:2-polyprenyl-3-methyl-5-hydroxy-6-metoxy-1,4-benzoquinol methylase